MSWEDTEKKVASGPWGLFKVICMFAVGIFALVMLLGFLGFVSNPFTQAARIVEKTIDADNVIYNYEWFHARYEEVKAAESKIKVSDADVTTFKEEAGARKDWTFEDKTEYSRLRSILTGLKQHRADLVTEYNARSKMINRKIFKGDLPKTILE